MQHPDWRYPYAGLRLVGIAAEYLEVGVASVLVFFLVPFHSAALKQSQDVKPRAQDFLQ
jgi:hypothetical protein